LQQRDEDSVAFDHSPFRGQTKKVKTPHNGMYANQQDYSPLKGGRIDPNLNSFARQNAHR